MKVNVAASFAAMAAVSTTAEAVYPRAIQELPQYGVNPPITVETVEYEYEPSQVKSEVSVTSLDAGIPTLPSTGPVTVETEAGPDPTTVATELDRTQTQSGPSAPPTASFPHVGTTTYAFSATPSVNREDGGATTTCEDKDTVDNETNPADEGSIATTTAPARGNVGYEAACSEAAKGAGSGAGVICGNGVAATAPFGNLYVSGGEALACGSILTGVLGIIFA
ncbi:hypothetical protein HDU81_007184 [Chytriomyces hyalinus]|nr:hypothetical protein HDU81_007184 [Chytriomyces hyalinus]